MSDKVVPMNLEATVGQASGSDIIAQVASDSLALEKPGTLALVNAVTASVTASSTPAPGTFPTMVPQARVEQHPKKISTQSKETQGSYANGGELIIPNPCILRHIPRSDDEA